MSTSPKASAAVRFSSGCIGLISSGTSSQESAFLDASENGDDVFFLTAAQLVPADTDDAYDIYDAHVCSEASPCTSSSELLRQRMRIAPGMQAGRARAAGVRRPRPAPASKAPGTPPNRKSAPSKTDDQAKPLHPRAEARRSR